MRQCIYVVDGYCGAIAAHIAATLGGLKIGRRVSSLPSEGDVELQTQAIRLFDPLMSCWPARATQGTMSASSPCTRCLQKGRGNAAGRRVQRFQKKPAGPVAASSWFPAGCQGLAKSVERRRGRITFIISIRVTCLVFKVSAQSLAISRDPAGRSSSSSCWPPVPDVAEGQFIFSQRAPGQTFNTTLKTSGCSAKSLSSKRSCDPDTSTDYNQISPFLVLSL